MYSNSNQERYKYLEVGGKELQGVCGTEVHMQWGAVAKPQYGGLADFGCQKLSVFAYMHLKCRHLVMNQTTFYTL